MNRETRETRDDDAPKMRTVTYTMSEVELTMLDQLVRWRHPTDPKALSMTVRECIRETYEREAARRAETPETSGK